MQLIMRVIFKPNRRRRHPFGMFFCNALLRNTRKPQLLVLAQLSQQASQPIGIRNDGRADRAGMASVNNQIARIHLHNLVARALGVERQRDAALLAVLFAVAVARVVEVADALGVQWDQAQAVGDEFVGKYGCVDLDFDQVDGNRGHFGLDDSPQGVGKG